MNNDNFFVSRLSDVGCRVQANSRLLGVAASDCCRFLVCRVSVVECMLTVDYWVFLSVIAVVTWLYDVGCKVHAVC